MSPLAGPAAAQFSRVAALPVLAKLVDLTVISSVDAVSAIVAAERDASKARCIGTHSGAFHCDEALACAMLKMLPSFESHAIARSRNPQVLDRCEIVVDVGAEYDAAALRFDHHQRTFDGTLDDYGTKLSSAGLVYKHYGRDVIRRIAEGCGVAMDDALLSKLYDRVYKGFVQEIDAIDNGIKVAEATNYRITTNLSARVGKLNPRWNEDNSDDIANLRFAGAVQLCGHEFVECVHGLLTSWLPARSIVEEAIGRRHEVHASGEVVQLSGYCPWSSHLFDIEGELGIGGEVKYVLYEDTHGKWRIQAVPVEEGSFDSRKKLPAPWRGLRDDDLSKHLDLPGCIFVHAAGFIGGHATLDGVREMASRAVAFEA